MKIKTFILGAAAAVILLSAVYLFGTESTTSYSGNDLYTAVVQCLNRIFADANGILVKQDPGDYRNDANNYYAAIGTGDINSTKIADGTVGTVDINNSAVTSGKIADGTVGTADINDGTVASADIADGTVTGTDINDSSVTSADIADGTVTSDDINDGTIAAGDLAGDAVTSAKIADGTVTTADINDGTVASADVAASLIQTASVDINIAEVKTLYSAPKTLLSAPGTHNYYEFLGATLIYDSNSAAYETVGANMTIKYTDGSGAAASGTLSGTGFLDQTTADKIAKIIPAAVATTTATSIDNQILCLCMATADPCGAGDGVLHVKMSYRTIASGL